MFQIWSRLVHKSRHNLSLLVHRHQTPDTFVTILIKRRVSQSVYILSNAGMHCNGQTISLIRSLHQIAYETISNNHMHKIDLFSTSLVHTISTCVVLKRLEGACLELSGIVQIFLECCALF